MINHLSIGLEQASNIKLQLSFWKKNKTKNAASALSSVFNNWLKSENLKFIKDAGKDIYEVQEQLTKPQAKY